MQRQAGKARGRAGGLAAALERAPADAPANVAVVGCGPAGLALAAALAREGVPDVVLVGPDRPFVNNYGVWRDEFADLGLEDTLDHTWDDTQCFFGEGREVRVGRAYSRVCRDAFFEALVGRCAAGGVRYLEGEMRGVQAAPPGSPAGTRSTLELEGGASLEAGLVVLCSGAGAGDFLEFEPDAPAVGAQTAYGFEARVSSYPLDPDAMLFMDYRRHHSGVADGAALRIKPGEHPNGGDGFWGAERETPSFLYAMPLEGGERPVVFFEETCLAAKDALPFDVLSRRLHRRLRALGVEVEEVLDEEWSYIPIGGPLPLQTQGVVSFGAAANLVHPATGYSVSRSLKEAGRLAAELGPLLGAGGAGARAPAAPGELSRQFWESLWSHEKRRQAAFHVFGMELLAGMDGPALNGFFLTFFSLQPRFWHGFLSSTLSSSELVLFALYMFAVAPLGLKYRLVAHLLGDASGSYLIRHFTGRDTITTAAAAAAD